MDPFQETGSQRRETDLSSSEAGFSSSETDASLAGATSSSTRSGPSSSGENPSSSEAGLISSAASSNPSYSVLRQLLSTTPLYASNTPPYASAISLHSGTSSSYSGTSSSSAGASSSSAGTSSSHAGASSSPAGASSSAGTGSSYAGARPKGPNPPVQQTLRVTEYRILHSVFDWEIENLSALHNTPYHCLSPVFDLVETRWYLYCNPKINIDGEDKMSLKLQRDVSDEGPRTVRVSFKLGLKNGTSFFWLRPEECQVVAKGERLGYEFSNAGFLDRYLYGHQALCISCELYVWYSLKDYTPQNREKPYADVSLSSDLLILLERNYNYDISLATDNGNARAHKHILSARSEKFARLLNEVRIQRISIPCSLSCLNCILGFIYSGDFDYLARTFVFGIGLYEMAREYHLRKLIELLTPQNIYMKSQIIVKPFKRRLTLKDFAITPLCSRNVETDSLETSLPEVRVEFYVEEMVDPENVDIRVEISEFRPDDRFSFELEVFSPRQIDPPRTTPGTVVKPLEEVPVDGGDEDPSRRRTMFRSTFRFSKTDIISNKDDDIQSKHHGEVLLGLSGKRLNILNFRGTVLHDTNTLKGSSDYKAAWLDDLSADMKNLHAIHYMSDITLSVPDFPHIFKLHRCVLAARSRYFYNVFANNNYKNCIYALRDIDITGNVLQFVLQFLYTGVIDNSSIDEKMYVLDFYKASELLSLASLKKATVEALSRSLSPDNVADVMEVARRFGNQSLVRACLDYQLSNGLV